ncbi:MAG: GerMN domain-containing protein [Spirochaetes bacterium]|nr:GerMN domain-containing protein [Spirochaetota bacterium]
MNWGRIKATFEETGFNAVVDQNRKPGGKPPLAPVTVEEEPGSGAKPAEPVPGNGADPDASANRPTETGPVAKPASERPAEHPVSPAPAGEKPVTGPATPTESKPVVTTRVAVLFFVRIDDDGVISRQEVKRTVQAGDSPLTDALGALLKGPNEEELRKGLITLIPQGTKLLSARIRDGTAYLNFNEAFMYNKYGIEGYAGQLRQVIYSATDFSTVRDVQILIEGRTVDYLGGEGVYIGRPLSRSSF